MLFVALALVYGPTLRNHGRVSSYLNGRHLNLQNLESTLTKSAPCSLTDMLGIDLRTNVYLIVLPIVTDAMSLISPSFTF